MTCITRVSRCGAGGGRTMGIWEGSVCLLHPGVPTASTGEPQTRSHPQEDTLRFHSPLQPGVWGSTTISPKFTFKAKHKCLCGQKQPRALCPGSTAAFPRAGPPCASPATQHLLQKRGSHTWKDIGGDCSLMARHVALCSSRLEPFSCCAVGRLCTGADPSLWRFLFLVRFPPRSSARGSIRSVPLTYLSPLGKLLPSRLMRRGWWLQDETAPLPRLATLFPAEGGNGISSVNGTQV